MSKNFVLLLVLGILTFGCSSVKEGLSMKKKQSVNEFLIEKKNPLVLPPEYSELPVPIGKEDNSDKEDENIDVSKVLTVNGEKKTSSNQSKDLEKSISNILNSKWK